MSEVTYEAVKKGSAQRNPETDEIIEGSEEVYPITSFEANGEETVRANATLGAIIFPYQELTVDLENDEFFVREVVVPESEPTQ